MSEKTSVGGQAVVEGVMMRTEKAVSVAVRKQNRSIIVKVKLSTRLSDRFPFLRKPFLRGILVLIETLIEGISALNFSAQQASLEREDDGKGISKGAIIVSMMVSFAFAFLLFAVIPHVITLALGFVLENQTLSGGQAFLFHLVDGLVKCLIFLVFIYSISLMKDMRRVFEYHGAEHQAVHAYESKDVLIPEHLSKYPTAHPRCGTSFLLIVILLSILVFAVVFPFVPVLSENKIVNQMLYILIKAPLILPIASLSYEMIRLSGKKGFLGRFFSYPGLLFQKITTQRPDKDQQEVAIIALRLALNPEMIGLGVTKNEMIMEFSGLEDFSKFYFETYE